MISSRITHLILVALFVSLCASVANAQCPYPPPPPTSSLWNGPFVKHVVLGGGCEVDVTYCTRIAYPGTEEFIYTSVEITSGPCSDWPILLSLLNDLFLGEGKPCDLPPCSGIGGFVEKVVFQATCWKIVNTAGNPNDPPILQAQVCSESGYCKRVFEICCNESDTYVVTEVSSEGYTEEGCEVLWPGISTYVLNQCYIMLPPCD
jgi:hypothetical protein